MSSHATAEFGPRFIGSPTGTLRAAVLVRPARAIERVTPLNGEPGVIFDRACEQHAVLVRTLRYFGVEVQVFDGEREDGRCVAVADTAVFFENGAVFMRQSAMGRRAEAEYIEAKFMKMDVPIAGHIAAPGLLDGGDVLLAADTAFIGIGKRGNSLGRGGFAEVARAHGYRTVEVCIAEDVCALRNVIAVLDAETLVVAPEKVDLSAFTNFKTIVLERGEELGAGILTLGNRHVIADVRYRTALKRLRQAGITVEGIDLYEFEKVGITPSMLVLAMRRT